jgi:biopolymer transport protein ExbD
VARKPSRRFHKDPLKSGLDLVPVMNLFMVLIPFLLLSAVFAKTAIIDVHLPRQDDAKREASRVTPADILTIRVSEKGLAFGGLGKDIGFIGSAGGSLDFALMSEKLLGLKELNPSSREAIILFSGNTPYDIVIKTMDAAREITRVKDGNTVRYRLFPLISVGEHMVPENIKKDKG